MCIILKFFLAYKEKGKKDLVALHVYFTKYIYNKPISGKYLDILAISCDSFNPDVNETIGRQQGEKNHLQSLRQVRNWCYQYKVS